MIVSLSRILLVPILLQANIAVPTQPSKPKQDCHAELTVLSDGTRQFKDCSGAVASIKRESAHKGRSGSRTVETPTDDPATNARYQESLRTQYDYQIYSYGHAKRTFDWQYWSGKLIFWIVLLLVGTGVFFSAVQFYLGLRHPVVRDPAKNESAVYDPTASEFEATIHGIKLKSSVLGLLILAMSMVFFYLYLSYVYPVRGVSP